MRKIGIGILMCLVLSAGVGVFTASKSDNDVLREARDRSEIEDLMWRYTRALDTGDGAAYAATYTTDGQFGTGANATKGREALQKLAGGQPASSSATAPKRAPMYHMTANERITFSDKDHARVEAYYLTARAAGGQDQPLSVLAVGRSIDDVVRVNGQWLIKSRNVAPTD
jgi:3-phenylpropionate/cinnamic acid dioxygenase small subunit